MLLTVKSIVEQCEYLGCMVDKHLELKNMVEERAFVSKNALGVWFNWWRTELDGIRVGCLGSLWNHWWRPLCCMDQRFGGAIGIWRR